ncbi:uncharacterized protein B0I36DRAFT_427775 [Microdochium trichocladiopsis]|uniref:WSC domain-containing protein n=1 Tax=Microdochium trichocladiopsis TaxID=1682393 RepID=A0A9P8YKC1_9PEZI|nr:uncharacterized protein B0I36DRAFT_427775 [Microdochium trichocladiopsis]KAH7041618.1 hypothetical protein B0I36DRAFT_427775 [Microdochium trichocladiopsis]
MKSYVLLSLLATLGARAADLGPKQNRTWGCYGSLDGGDFNDPRTWIVHDYQSAQQYCRTEGHTLAAFKGTGVGTCGDQMPPDSALVDDAQCDQPCYANETNVCGGNNAWIVIVTAKEASGFPLLPGPSSTSSTPGPTIAPSPTSTGAAVPRDIASLGGLGVALGLGVLGGVWLSVRIRVPKLDSYKATFGNACNVYCEKDVIGYSAQRRGILLRRQSVLTTSKIGI